MGCGKTYWGEQLSRKLGLPFFDLDHVIEEREETTINTIFNEKGEAHFRLLEKEVLYMLTESHESFVMATGGGTPCFYNNIEYMKKSGTAVWIHCNLDDVYKRLVQEREHRPLVRALSDGELQQYIIKKFADRKIYYEQATTHVAEQDLTLDALVSAVFHD